MAAAINFQRGLGPIMINGVIAAWRLGNSATVTTGASSANIALPTDPNGNLYAAYLVQSTATAWWDFCTTGADTVVAAAANATPAVPGQGSIPCVVPPGAGFIAAIQDAAAGKVTFTGCY